MKTNFCVYFFQTFTNILKTFRYLSQNDLKVTLKRPQLHFETFYNYFSGQYETTDHNWSTIGPIRIAKPFEPPQLNIPRSYKKQIKIKNGQKLHLKIGFSASNESQLGCLLFFYFTSGCTSGCTSGQTCLTECRDIHVTVSLEKG